MLAAKPKQKQKQKKSRQEINEASRELKRKRKHKGLPSGSRFNDQNDGKNKQGNKTHQDPRIGSKTPIPLVLDASSKPVKQPIEKVMPKKVRLSPEQELEQLENDPKLDALLDLFENDETLTDEQQHYLDTKLNRIDELMQILGYTDEDFDDEDDDDKKEDIVGLLKRK